MTRIFLIIALAMVCGCKKWDDHNAITSEGLKQDLYEQISQDPSLSSFAELLEKSGYAEVIASSKTFTVFAPGNEALATLDPAIVNDPARLKRFVGNHIANQSWFTAPAGKTFNIEMLNGKYLRMQAKTVEDATITTADRYAKNGVIQVVDRMLPALDNTWEALENNTSIPAKQKAYMLSLFRNVFDVTNAEQIGVNPVTGEPIYRPGTDSIRTNIFWRNVHDLRDESRRFTLFVLEDAAWDTEVTKLNPFFVTGTADSTRDLSAWEVVKDFAVDSAYTLQTLPDTLTSVSGVRVPIEKAQIKQTILTSNGVIYVMGKIEVAPERKLLSFRIDAEFYRAQSVDKRGNTFFRDRFNPVTQLAFKDVLVFNHGTSRFNLSYRLQNMYSVKYKVYWVAVNDFQSNNFSQKLGIGTPDATLLDYVTVTPDNYEEVLVGEFTLDAFHPLLDIYLTAANTTNAANSALVCDYIRLEPSFN
ncbi:fasciclin domain-containing protein [Chitinophaga cymbidii]|nr:fasciclin domain-containing protein [Chitinophaga cymbidii]